MSNTSNTIEIDIAILRRLISYDPETGELTWKTRTPDLFEAGPKRSAESICRWWNSRWAGTPALACDNGKGYRRGGIFGQKFQASRVIFALHFGRWPDGVVDHRNGITDVNSISALRDITQQQNMKNAKKRSNNTSGVTGVYWNKAVEKWQAYITVDCRRVHLGLFDDLEEARAVRRKAEIEHGYDPLHGLDAEARELLS
ncbi:HNH endonuclease [Falsiruegeria litorea]|uniref:HNH endonuclease n=1 Tax=Falsiruegeria litorea TaxID=1280831 RepID=UPI001BFD8C8D|nr:HNH endonuclease [Falsiruegeria litorea]MBT8169661.1 HNH endonuclease [Falsiruegeria litorea]